MAIVHTVIVPFDSCVISARVIERHDGLTLGETLYSPTFGRMDSDELAVRESDCLGQTVSMDRVEAIILETAVAQLAGRSVAA